MKSVVAFPLQFLDGFKHSIFQTTAFMEDLADAQLVVKAKTGDKDAFGRLAEKYWPMAYYLAYQRTGDAAEAEDIAQESFIKTQKYLMTIREASKFSSWFYGLVLQLTNERRRKKRPIPIAQIPELEDGPANPLNALTVQEAMNSLPADYQVVLTLRFWQDMSCDEIARHLGEAVGTVTSRLTRAYQMLKEKLR